MLLRHKLPAGFIPPCAPVLVLKPPEGTGWLHEVKQDGDRIIARKNGKAVHLWIRGASNKPPSDYATHMVRIATAISKLRATSCTIDGEAVVFRADGSCDFHSLRGAAGQAAAELIAFDLLEFDGEDLRPLPIEERRERLVHLMRLPPDGLILSEIYDAPGDVVFAHACSLGVEGIVSKRRGSAYRSGRSDNWRKTLCPDYRRR